MCREVLIDLEVGRNFRARFVWAALVGHLAHGRERRPLVQSESLNLSDAVNGPSPECAVLFVLEICIR